MICSAPILEGPRLRLRGHRAEDHANLTRLWGDQRVLRHIGIAPASHGEAWDKLLRFAGLWPVIGYGHWAVEDRETSDYLGDVGLADFRRDLTPPLVDMPEIGWVLLPEAHGRGLATEAARLVVGWADDNLSCRQTACIFDPEHTASLRVATKCGYAFSHDADFAGQPAVVMARSRGG